MMLYESFEKTYNFISIYIYNFIIAINYLIIYFDTTFDDKLRFFWSRK